MTAEPELSRAVQAAVGSRLGRVLELVRELRTSGVDGPELASLEQAVREIGAAAAARLPAENRGAVQAALASLLVTAMELAPRRMRGYGRLSHEEESFLEQASERLQILVERLIEVVDRNDR